MNYIFSFHTGPDWHVQKIHRMECTASEAEAFVQGLQPAGAKYVVHAVDNRRFDGMQLCSACGQPSHFGTCPPRKPQPRKRHDPA